MPDPTSRYSASAKLEQVTRSGRRVLYLERRFLPPVDAIPAQLEVPVINSYVGRLDRIASEMLGDPRLYWRICDCCGDMNPFEVAEVEDRILKVSVSRL